MNASNIRILHAYYAKYNPENTKNIDEIAKKFGGREEVLKAKLQKKYGVAPALQSIRPQQIVQAVVKAVATYDPNYRRITCPRVSSSMDCRSKAFDPLQLLLKPVQRSTATTPLDNLSKCRYLLPTTHPEYLAPHLLKRKTIAVKPVTETKTKTKSINVLDSLIESTCSTGPFRFFQTCWKRKCRIVVIIRRVNSIRGMCRGFLKAVDKHMNLCLLDVYESILPQDSTTCPSLSVEYIEKNAMETKYSKQMLIRGDNVAMIYMSRN